MPQDQFCVRSYRIDDEILVVADLPGVSIGDLTVGFTDDPTELIIEVENIYRARVPLPWKTIEYSDARLNNGVFEISIYPSKMETTRSGKSGVNTHQNR